MGRLYTKSVVGDKTLAYFEAGQVRRKESAGAILVYYDSGGYIYKEPDSPVLATCGSNGHIHKGQGLQGAVLAKCEDGKIYEGGSRRDKVLAWYDGDMYGAAAAILTVLTL